MTEMLLEPVRRRAAQAVLSKLGELGTDGNNKDFEAAFSNLAHAYARDSCPTLEPYEVGFELLERADDGKRAVGIIGYQVGDQLLYTPVFWLAGKIKGQELLFLKDQSIFVPLKENWVNYMLERKMPEIGKSVARDPLRLGIRRPDILRQTRSGLKYAGMDMFHDLNSMPPAMPAEQHPAAGAQQPTPLPQLPQAGIMNGQPMQSLAFPQPAGQPAMQPAIQPAIQPPMPMAPPMPQQQPAMGQPEMPPQIANPGMAPEQAAMPGQLDPMAPDIDSADGGDSDSLDVMDGQNMTGGLPAPAKLAALRKMAELPQQDCVSLPEFIRYVGKRAFVEFGNILETAPAIAKLAFEIHGQGLLDALKDAEHYEPPTAAQCAAFHQQLKQALGQDTEVNALDISDDGETVTDRRPADKASKTYADALNTTLFNPSHNGVYDIVLRYGKIERCLVSLNSRGHYSRNAAVVVTLRDSCKQSFRNVSCLDQLWATREYGLEAFEEFAKDLPTAASLDTASGPAVVLVTRKGEAVGPLTMGKIVAEHDGQTTYLTNNGRELVVDDGGSKNFRGLDERIYVPAKAKVLSCSEYDNDTLSLGTPGEINREAFAGLDKLAVFQEGNFVTVATPAHRRTVKRGRDAMLLLMAGHGLNEVGARHVLKEAAAHPNPVKLRIKYGDNAYLATNQRIGPQDDVPNDYGSYDMISGESVPEVERQFVNSPVDIPPQFMRPADKAHYVQPNNESAFQVAQEAGQQGNSQAFDAGVLTSMLRNMRDDQLIDRFIPALSRAMDAAGRLLYQFYWHQEDFAERYGDKDMPDLGDSLRNIFEGLGDIVLKLKQKTVDPYPEEQDLGVNLTDLAGAS